LIKKISEKTQKHKLHLAKFEASCKKEKGAHWSVCYEKAKAKCTAAFERTIEEEKRVSKRDNSRINKAKRRCNKLKANKNDYIKSKRRKNLRKSYYRKTWTKKVMTVFPKKLFKKNY